MGEMPWRLAHPEGADGFDHRTPRPHLAGSATGIHTGRHDRQRSSWDSSAPSSPASRTARTFVFSAAPARTRRFSG